MALRNYSSTAARTTLSAGVTAVTTTLTVAATTGFPAAPFVLAVNAGATAQELVLVTNVAGTTLTVTRGYDSTVASAHDAGAVVEHSHAAIEFREANAHVNATTGVHGTTGDLVGTTQVQTLTNKTLTAPAATGSLANFGVAWTAYVPTLTGATQGNGTLTGAYIQIGKTVHFWARFVLGSTSAVSGTIALGLPVAPSVAHAHSGLQSFITDPGVNNYVGIPVLSGATCQTYLMVTSGAHATLGVTNATTPMTWATSDEVLVNGSYEAA